MIDTGKPTFECAHFLEQALYRDMRPPEAPQKSKGLHLYRQWSPAALRCVALRPPQLPERLP